MTQRTATEESSESQQADPETGTLTPWPEYVEALLASFQPFEDTRLNRAFHALPLVIVVIFSFHVFAGWFSSGIISMSYLTTALALTTSILISR